MPNKDDSLRLAVIGDTGTGGKPQYAVAAAMAAYHDAFPFELVLMLGDNIYGDDSPAAMLRKFEVPYRPLLEGGVKFYAALGNHDNPHQAFYAPFHMDGARYYTFKAPRGSVRFFALDSNYLDPDQVKWLEEQLAAAKEDWKICFFHHPLYSSAARHGPDLALREVLEPILIRHGVALVLTGHEHVYERMRPQHGILHIICGNSAKLRRGNLRSDPVLEKGYDQGNSFMLLEIDGDELHFQTIAADGSTIDSGTWHRPAPAR